MSFDVHSKLHDFISNSYLFARLLQVVIFSVQFSVLTGAKIVGMNMHSVGVSMAQWPT